MAEDGSSERLQKASVPAVRTALKQIGEELSNEELHKLLFLAADNIPKGKSQEMDSLNFFSALQERQLIDTKENNLDYLIDLLGNLSRFDLIKKLQASLPGSNYKGKVVVHREVADSNDGIVTTANTTLEISTSVGSVNENNGRDGGFHQDPDLVQSMFQNYEDSVKKLELSLAQNAELKKKNHELEFEINQMKDDQNNLIRERNSALGAKSEYVFRQSELLKEVSDLKRCSNLLGKNGMKADITIEKQEQEILKLKASLKEFEMRCDELTRELEKVRQEKNKVEEELAKFKKTEETNGRLTCKRCGLVYVEANNPVDACLYHSGKFGIVGSIKKRMEWSCCKNTNKNAPGCCKKKHLSIDFPLSPAITADSRTFTM